MKGRKRTRKKWDAVRAFIRNLAETPRDLQVAATWKPTRISNMSQESREIRRDTQRALEA